MSPSFLTLFKRGRYFRSTTTSVTDPAFQQRTWLQQERFVAAAIAFCFKHDLDFRRHFWVSVCGESCETNPESLSVELEPKGWADLRVLRRLEGQRSVHVVECKIEADLQAHQDPRTTEFVGSSGYGRMMVDSESPNGSLLSYTILGHREPLSLPPAHRALPIRLAQRQWDDLERGCPATPLINDLFDSFAEMNVGKFAMRKVRVLKISAGLENVGTAQRILEAVVSKLKLIPNYCEPKAEQADEASSFGMWVKPPPPRKYTSTLQKHLKDVTKCTNNYGVAWFGYESDSSRGTRRSVWLFCGDQPVADWLSGQISKLSYTAEPQFDEEWAVAISGGQGAQSDLDWFLSVFEAVRKLRHRNV